MAAASGASSGPQDSPVAMMRESAREVKWYCASSMVGAASAQTQSAECGSGWRALGR